MGAFPNLLGSRQDGAILADARQGVKITVNGFGERIERITVNAGGTVSHPGGAD